MFFEGVPKQFDSGMLSLGELLSRKGSKIKYEYDFGDSWIHEIILESCQSYKKEEIPVIALLMVKMLVRQKIVMAYGGIGKC